MPVVTATYRLQLNKDFPFTAAQALVPYLAELGVSHAYLSPILMAQPGSTHGYDTIDHTRINPELGTVDDFRRFSQALAARGMGIILDFVPNHMGVGGAHNWLWLDVLKHGPNSRYADWFDINWTPARHDLAGKLMVPFLGTSYAEALNKGDLALKADDDGFAIWAYDSEKLPLRPEDEKALQSRYSSPESACSALNGQAGDAGSWAELHDLIENQHWRLMRFSAADDDINYRRFFINNELAGIRIERPEVFDHAHQVIFELIAEGLVDGLRIDHVDGLLDPIAYLAQLKAKSPRPIYLAIEKILAPHEELRPDWPVDGTTGYEFGAALTRVLTSAAGEEQVTRTYHEFVGPASEPEAEAYQCKLRVMDGELAAELAGLGRALADLARSVPATRDLTEHGLRKAIGEVVAHLRVYRTYIDQTGISEADRQELRLAIDRARQHRPFYAPGLFDFIERVLSGGLGPQSDPERIEGVIGRVQQFSGPVMAKGLEDTTLYRYNRLVCLNEVGAHPDRFSLPIAGFHDANRYRLKHHPQCMLATSTHDTKRGEDTRALIGAIADSPALWDEAVKQWRDHLAPEGIHPNDLYLLFQLLLGGWPIAAESHNLDERLKGTMQKSLREARQRSDWGVRNDAYEAKVLAFIDHMLADTDFLAQFHQSRTPLAEIGRRKALIQAALRLTCPGVPDTYRGAEDWEQSFVDPDNRRPVDFAALERRLRNPQGPADEKLDLTHRVLQLRKRLPQLFLDGSYQPVAAGDNVLAFKRQHEGIQLLVAADLSPGHKTGVMLDEVVAGQGWINALTGVPYIGDHANYLLVLVSEPTGGASIFAP